MNLELDQLSDISEYVEPQIFGTDEYCMLSKQKQSPQAFLSLPTLNINNKEIDTTPFTNTNSSILKQIDLYEKQISYESQLHDIYGIEQKEVLYTIESVKENEFSFQTLCSDFVNKEIKTLNKKYVFDFKQHMKPNNKTKLNRKRKQQKSAWNGQYSKKYNLSEIRQSNLKILYRSKSNQNKRQSWKVKISSPTRIIKKSLQKKSSDSFQLLNSVMTKTKLIRI